MAFTLDSFLSSAEKAANTIGNVKTAISGQPQAQPVKTPAPVINITAPASAPQPGEVSKLPSMGILAAIAAAVLVVAFLAFRK